VFQLSSLNGRRRSIQIMNIKALDGNRLALIVNRTTFVMKKFCGRNISRDATNRSFDDIKRDSSQTQTSFWNCHREFGEGEQLKLSFHTSIMSALGSPATMSSSCIKLFCYCNSFCLTESKIYGITIGPACIKFNLWFFEPEIFGHCQSWCPSWLMLIRKKKITSTQCPPNGDILCSPLLLAIQGPELERFFSHEQTHEAVSKDLSLDIRSFESWSAPREMTTKNT
jgi:hypothetical protein